jgi:predicted NAD/FAD-dependent oxidoreductase
MEHSQILKAIQFIRPDAGFSLSGTELTWLDENQTEPTKKQIEDGWVAYQAAEKAKAEEAAAQKQLVIEKLGLTAEEVSALLA